MQNKTYAELASLIEALAGVDNFTTAEDSKILALANRQLYQAYLATPLWPRYIVGAQARPANDGVISREYDEAAGVATVSSGSRSGTTVTAICSAAVTFVPGMSVVIAGMSFTTETPNGTQIVTGIDTTTIDDDTFTFELDDGTGTESYGAGTASPVAVADIADVHRVYSGNPFSNVGGYDVEWYEDVDGIHVTGTNEGLAGYYVGYKKQWPGPYLSSATDIPFEFFHYAAHATYADFLRMDGDHSKALAEEQVAQMHLIAEVNKAAIARNGNRAYSRTITHNSTQAR